MNKAVFLLLLCCLLAGMVGCMSSTTNVAGANIITIPTPVTAITAGPSHISHRVFVSNSTSGNLQIVDADRDALSAFGISIGGSPTVMVQTPDLKNEVVYDSLGNTLSQITNSTEVVNAKQVLPGATESVTLSADGSMAFAAIPTAQALISGTPTTVTGAIYSVAYTPLTSSTPGTATLALLTGVQGVRWIAEAHTVANILAFSDGAAANSVTVVNGTSGATLLFTLTGFDHPVAGYFSSDDTTAFVLSSGPAHGGTQAMVTRVDMTPTAATPPAAPNAVSSAIVAGATVGFLSADNSTLYVAGPQPCSSPPCGVPTGVLSVISTSAMTVTSSVPLGPGTPSVMTSDGTNVWIGSTGCQVSTASPQGCLSMFFPASGQVAVNQPSQSQLQNSVDDVTSILSLNPLNSRNVMYVVEGGDLVEYSFSQAPPTINPMPVNPSFPQNLHIPGQAYDAKAVQ